MVFYMGIKCCVIRYDASIGLYDLENIETFQKYSAWDDEVIEA